VTPPAHFPELDFPPGPDFELVQRGSDWEILDRVRRRYVRLTPEEWVRQHLLRTLIHRLGYPQGLIALEPTLKTPAGPRRPDVVAYDRMNAPCLIAECKAPSVPLDQSVFEQVAVYNTITRAGLLVVTNGRQHFCWRASVEPARPEFLAIIPPYHQLDTR
jgi:hypothetical protein